MTARYVAYLLWKKEERQLACRTATHTGVLLLLLLLVVAVFLLFFVSSLSSLLLPSRPCAESRKWQTDLFIRRYTWDYVPVRKLHTCLLDSWREHSQSSRLFEVGTTSRDWTLLPSVPHSLVG